MRSGSFIHDHRLLVVVILVLFRTMHVTPLETQWSSFRAHTDNRKGETDSLVGHLVAIAGLAERVASPFGGGDIARLAGLLHDVGKVIPGFQEYLQRIEAGERVTKGPPHAVWGAAIAYLAFAKHPAIWKCMALPVLGHHGGLSDASGAPYKPTCSLISHGPNWSRL
jgi:hypothetical protein